MYDNPNSDLQNIAENLKKYFFLALGYWYIVVIAIALSFTYAKIKNRYAKRIYSIYTTIYIEPYKSRPEIYAGGIPIMSGVNLENEMGILTSYDLNYKVITQLDEFKISYFLKNKFSADKELYKSSPFEVIVDSTSKNPQFKYFVKILDSKTFEIWKNKEKHKKLKFGEYFTDGNIKFFILKTQYFSPAYYGRTFYFIKHNVAQLAHEYSQRLKINKRSPNSSILWLWMETSVPYKDIDYLNKLAELYIKQRLEQKNQIAIKTIEFIDNQLKTFSDSLKQAEDLMQNLKQKNIHITDKGANLNDELKTIELQIKKLEIKQTYYKQLLQILENSDYQSIVPPAAIGIDDKILDDYLMKLSDAIYSKQIIDLTVKQDQIIPIAKLKQVKIQQIKNSLIQYIKQAISYTQNSIKELKNKKQQIQEELLQIPIAERELMQITRKFDINNQIYTFLMERRMEAGITLASSKPDARVIDKARPETIRFKKKVGYISTTKAIIFSIILAFTIIFLINILDTKIKNKNEIEALTKIPIAGTITHNKTGSILPVINHPRSTIAESFRSLKTNLLYFSIDKPAKKILITSTISSEGKSFIASNLAALFAISNKKTVIVETDLRKPKIHNNFNVDNNVGISTYLIGESQYEQILIKTNIDNLWIIPSGEIPPNPVELLESQKMQKLVKKLEQDFDYIIFDTPPVGIVTDALVIARYSDIFLFVIRLLYSTRQSIKLINDIKSKHGIEKIMIVVNDIRISLMYGIKYGYNYGYGYGYGYSYGYGYYEDESQNSWTQRISFKIRKLVNKIFG